MYARSYSEDSNRIPIPQGYEGTALLGDMIQKNDTPPTSHGVTQEESIAAPPGEDDAVETSGGSFFGALPFADLFGGLFSGEKFGLKSIGFEEILIGAVALYLLFSKNSDIECAIMLIILLFIT